MSIVPFYNQSVLPTIVGSVPYLRKILRKESVQIVHGHSAFSTLAHEVKYLHLPSYCISSINFKSEYQALFIGALLGLRTVFTDHSLFGFADASAIVTNTFLQYSLANTDHCICVSHTGKENTVLRLKFNQTTTN